MYSIYVHTTPDGKKYVGSTSKENPERRWRKGEKYKVNIRFYNAIKSVGWDNIQHQVLETVEDKKTAIKREEYYTLLFRSNEPEFGYNIYVGYIQNEETKKKHSERCKGIKQSEETKKKKSEKKKEFYKNKELSEYSSKILSETNRKPIRLKNINTGEIIEFYSQKTCAAFFETSHSSVSNFFRGKSQSKVFNDYKVLK